MTEHEDDPTPVGGRRGYTRTMTTIMLVVVAIIIVVAIVQWVRVS